MRKLNQGALNERKYNKLTHTYARAHTSGVRYSFALNRATEKIASKQKEIILVDTKMIGNVVEEIWICFIW